MNARVSAVGAVAVILLCGVVLAGEPDWFTRVKEQGLPAACREEVARHEKGVLDDSLHVGECYYNLERWADGVEVFRRLRRSEDRNYAAAALARLGEGQFHLGEKQEAAKTFRLCLDEHPDAWLDGSVAERCRAWLVKLDGGLESLEPEKEERKESVDIASVKDEIQALSDRLDELKALLRELTGK